MGNPQHRWSASKVLRMKRTIFWTPNKIADFAEKCFNFQALDLSQEVRHTDLAQSISFKVSEPCTSFGLWRLTYRRFLMSEGKTLEIDTTNETLHLYKNEESLRCSQSEITIVRILRQPCALLTISTAFVREVMWRIFISKFFT